MLEGSQSNIALGLIAGMTIFLGLPVARIKGPSDAFKGMLSLASAGILIFLIIEVGYHAIETVEGTAKSGDVSLALIQGLVLSAGLFIGTVGLAIIEERRNQMKQGQIVPLEIAKMIAIGIGLHNFAEGLAIGQSYSSGNTALGLTLVLGFALHNATEGFGIAAPLAGTEVSWARLIALGLIGGAPTALGAALGGTFVNIYLELFILSLAVGSLIYVTRELLRLRFTGLGTTKGMTALTVGLLLGIATEIYVEAASVNHKTKEITAKPASKRIVFEKNEVEPSELTLNRGDNVSLVNETDKAIEIEPSGFMSREAFIPAKSQLTVEATGVPGKYALSPENSNLVARVNLLASNKNMEDKDTEQIIAALTIVAGHAQAAFDLHEDSEKPGNPDAALDLARAAKHSFHPVHEIFMDQTPNSLLVQRALENIELLNPLKEKLEAYSKLAGSKEVSTQELKNSLADLFSMIEKGRRQIAKNLYNKSDFRRRAARIVLEQAEDEYKEAVETGRIIVIKPATPGKDAFLEYQDTKGYLETTRDLLTLPNDEKCALAQQAIEKMLAGDFKTINPPDPNHPAPFSKVEKEFEAIEAYLD